jgi:two-component system chemotaxis response regulator CheB
MPTSALAHTASTRHSRQQRPSTLSPLMAAGQRGASPDHLVTAAILPDQFAESWSLALAGSRLHYRFMNHDVIVIGASAGGIEVLLQLVQKLPKDLPAAVFVVVHRPAGADELLPELINSRNTLPAVHPLHRQPIVAGQIYIAPPDNHLVLRQGLMEVVRGPKENGHRPAVDALFRSAARAYGPRVIGVVLSGYQDCGTAGLMSIKARGGITVAQAPQSALVPDMPRSAIERAPVDHVVTPEELPALLRALATTPEGIPAQPDRTIEQIEGSIAGQPSTLVCPACSGVLTEAHAGKFEHFRCHVGHAFSLDSLTHQQDEALERSLWAAVRALEESATLSRRLSAKEHGELGRRFAEKAATLTAQAEMIRGALLRGTKLAAAEAEDAAQS